MTDTNTIQLGYDLAEPFTLLCLGHAEMEELLHSLAWEFVQTECPELDNDDTKEVVHELLSNTGFRRTK